LDNTGAKMGIYWKERRIKIDGSYDKWKEFALRLCRKDNL
jgi:hypothetical protein